MRSRVAKTPEPKSDEDVVMKEKENTTPEKTNGINSKESTAHGDGPKKHRVKGKKMVTRTYEDEEGYISMYMNAPLDNDCSPTRFDT